MIRTAAAALAAGLLVTGCSGNGPDRADPPASHPAPSTPSASRPSPPTVNGVRPGAERRSSLDGTWTSGKVALHLFRGAAALNRPTFCSGTVAASGDITLTCANGDRTRTRGRASLTSRTLTVGWTGGVRDVLRRR
ncbi:MULTISPECIES: hypothetical protein [Actinomadura]|uniref:Serine/threonine protein kinase n=1 Tax=Actinomadura yumaensis TaxID=111807 RepID=A0ABW2CTQ2_9ACTN|nr:hypothetical protein [Actinomadura sp. J1-007]MWK36008.1 hypothetical protein [Actinomadura sp. J1-007]